jgi:uncharacterized protein
MKPRIIFIHGNGTTNWASPWAVWFKKELEKAGYPTHFETFPDSIKARSTYWLPFLKEEIKAGENDVIVGWSSGAVATMRYCEENKILGSVLVSPCYTDLGDDLEKQSGYFDKPWDWQKMKQHQLKTVLVYGDDDPFIPQEEFAVIAKELNTEVIEVKGGKHFIEKTEMPEVLEYILMNY